MAGSLRPSPASRPSVWHRRRYELLLAALLQHLFIAVVIADLEFYARVVWPLNMAVLGLFSSGVFVGRGTMHRVLKNVVAAVATALPLGLWIWPPTPAAMVALSAVYVIFFLLILVEILRYLVRPGQVNIDIVSAAICGFFLLLEVGIFWMQALYYLVPDGFRGLDTRSFTTVYLDLVYMCAVTVTSIGFGDITPAHHITKLAVAILGIAGQTYSVVLVGIMISKYAAASDS